MKGVAAAIDMMQVINKLDFEGPDNSFDLDSSKSREILYLNFLCLRRTYTFYLKLNTAIYANERSHQRFQRFDCYK